MEVWQLALILGGGLLLFLLLGIPVPFALGIITIIGTFLVWENPLGGLMGIISQASHQSTNFLLLAVPLFILMAELLLSSGISGDVFEALSRWVGRIPGGLALATLIMGGGFAAVTGSSLANAAIMGRVSIPEMLKRDYSKRLAGGCVATGGTLGILIPPSIPMIFYALFAEVSVGKMFMAGFIPGAILICFFGIYIMVHSILKPSIAPYRPKFHFKGAVGTSYKLIPLIALVIFMLYSFYTGVATPTEVAGLGAFVSLVIALAYRRLNWSRLKDGLFSTVRTTLMLMWILIAAIAFGQVLTYAGILHWVTQWVAGLSVSPIIVIIAIFFFLLVIGCVLETGTIIMVIGPLLISIAQAIGFDLIWFGVFFVINLEMALVTPPVGFNLFVMKGIAPDIPMGDIYRGVLPFVLCLVIGLALVVIFPQIALWLPGRM